MVTASRVDTSILEIQRTIKAPVAKVFKAWTEPDQMNKWFGCNTADSVRISQDFKVGGEYRIDVHCTDGRTVTASGSFLEIVPNRKLVYSWNNTSLEHPATDTLVSVEFIDKGDTTEISLTHSKFDRPVSVQGHSMGWGAALDKLEAFFA